MVQAGEGHALDTAVPPEVFLHHGHGRLADEDEDGTALAAVLWICSQP
jgi:hypothetical protein